MELNHQDKPESGSGKQDDLALDFELQNNQGKFPGSPVPDAAEIARAILETRSPVATAALPETPPPSPPTEAQVAVATPIPKLPEDAHMVAAAAASRTAAPPVAAPTSDGNEGGDMTATTWLRKRKKGGAIRISETASIGKILQEARVSCGMTTKDVEAETRIRALYVELLEQDNFKELPPPVYVRAYIRNLCNLYSLDRSMLEEILQHHYSSRQDHMISEEIYHQLEKDKQTNVEEETRVKRMILMLAAGGTALLVLIIGSIFFMVSAVRSPKVQPVSVGAETPSAISAAVAGSQFDLTKIERLRLPRPLEMEMLKPALAAGRGAVSRTERKR